MRLQELLAIQRKYLNNPSLAAQLPPGYMTIVQERIDDERRKMLDADNDPALNAQIEKYIQEGRITFDLPGLIEV